MEYLFSLRHLLYLSSGALAEKNRCRITHRLLLCPPHKLLPNRSAPDRLPLHFHFCPLHCCIILVFVFHPLLSEQDFSLKFLLSVEIKFYFLVFLNIVPGWHRVAIDHLVYTRQKKDWEKVQKVFCKNRLGLLLHLLHRTPDRNLFHSNLHEVYAALAE